MNHESEQTVRHHRRRRSIIREFCLNTSTHALPGIARSESFHNCVFWSISFLIFTGIMIYFIVKSIINYFDYPTSIDLSYNNDWQQYFAAVSFCNIAALRFDRFIQPFLNFTNSLNIKNTNDTTTISEYQSQFIWLFLVDQINKNQSLEDYSFPLSSMLQGCAYNFETCTSADFISFVSPSYGLCYTFNAKLKNSTDDSLRFGNFYGGAGILSLSLYVHSYQYVPYSTDAAGILVLIHDNRQVPMIETSGIELGPGRRYKLSYRKKKINLLSSPYTDCTNKISNPMKAMLSNYYPADYVYSQSNCYQICQQTYVYEQCGCVNPYLWYIRWIVLPGTDNIIFAPACYPSDDCFDKVSKRLFASASLVEIYCSDCSQECSTNSFVLQTSSSMLYIDSKLDTIKNFVENSLVPLPNNWSTTWRQHIYENYLTINILRETSIVETHTQTSTLGFVDVISNIGGQTGLWIGISFLSIMELIEMIYRLIRYQIHVIRESIQRKINIIQ
ncbi:unnamed protein product [Rotaria sordida]|uniref:Uncharacterized protein n=1 Tax=Rotaria sordida TaxID=392033 RepID=A0A819KS18_9BILA|nr:unnamed protein product [Rotaria sordida]CAF3953882.1 unnamed protein product [Rotaria sordida]